MGLECRPVAEHPRGYAAGPTSELLTNSIIRFVDFKFFSFFSSFIASPLEETSAFQNISQGIFLLVYFPNHDCVFLNVPLNRLFGQCKMIGLSQSVVYKRK